MLLLSDIRYAARSLSRRPGFAILAIATLGLGIGASTAIFSALYRLNYAQLPYETADRLVNLGRTREGQGFFLSPTPALVAAWQAESKLFEHIIISVPLELTLTGRGEPASLAGARVSPSLPDMLVEAPLMGRTFTDEDAAAGAAVVALSEKAWRTYFGADERVLGQVVQLGGRSLTVIAVMRDEFARYSDPFPRQDFWLPYREGPDDDYAVALGVMREGVTLEAASAELERIAASADVPTPPGTWNYAAVSISVMLGERMRGSLPILLGAVGLVLFIACANVAGLMIVRLNSRRREIAIRAALGARQRRILAGLAAEQMLIALAAGALGLLLAAWGISFLPHITPNAMPLLDTLSLDPAVLAFAGVLLLVSTLLAGVAPAFIALRDGVAESLRSGGDRVTSGTRARSVLVTVQIALSVILLIGAGLMLRSFASLQARDLGFDPGNVLTVELAPPVERYPGGARQAFYEDVMQGIRQIPGVSEVSVGGGAPPRLGLLFGSLAVEGSDVGTEGISYVAGTAAAAGYLPALRARFIGGRDFQPDDREMNVVVVNRRFVERFWPGENGVGKRIRLASGADAPWIEIVGVIENLRASGHSPTDDDLQVFYPIEWSYPGHTLVIRTAGTDPISIVSDVRRVIARTDPVLPLRQVATLESSMAETLQRERFNMVLLTIFAALALLLTVVGLYGLVAFTVQQRVREIGIRLALGATTTSVSSMFVAHGMRLVVVGAALGVLGGVAAVRLLRSLVHGVSLYDGLSFAAGVTLISAAALLASWLPARRAMRVDPLETLREN